MFRVLLFGVLSSSAIHGAFPKSEVIYVPGYVSTPIYSMVWNLQGGSDVFRLSGGKSRFIHRMVHMCWVKAKGTFTASLPTAKLGKNVSFVTKACLNRAVAKEIGDVVVPVATPRASFT